MLLSLFIYVLIFYLGDRFVWAEDIKLPYSQKGVVETYGNHKVEWSLRDTYKSSQKLRVFSKPLANETALIIPPQTPFQVKAQYLYTLASKKIDIFIDASNPEIDISCSDEVSNGDVSEKIKGQIIFYSGEGYYEVWVPKIKQTVSCWLDSKSYYGNNDYYTVQYWYEIVFKGKSYWWGQPIECSIINFKKDHCPQNIFELIKNESP